MSEWVSINGELVRGADARVSVYDAGFMQGVGLFETMRAYHGRIFRLDRHLARLRNSAAELGWQTVPEIDALEDAVSQVMATTDLDDARVRLTVTTGGLQAPNRDEPELTVVATAAAGGSYPAEMYRDGVTAVVTDYRQNSDDPTTGHKTTSYFARLAVLRQAHAKGALEALWFTNDRLLAEGSISNVLLFLNETLVTPPNETPVLPGVTRAAVMDLAQRLNIPVEQRDLTVEDLLAADEVLLTNSLMQVMPVVRLERERVGAEKPGPVFEELHEAYQLLVEEECG